MTTKIFKLFGIKIFEITTLGDGEQPIKESVGGGEVLIYTPEEAQKDKDKEALKKMNK